MKLARNIRSIAAAAALTTLMLPSTASADSPPSYAANTGEMIHGRISSVSGKYDLFVRDDRGYVDHIVLHDGTVINPTGLQLATGETVSIDGRPDGNVFRADEIDTPYSGDSESNGYDGPGDGYQNFSVGYPDGYSNPYAYGYGYPGYNGIYFGGGYYGGGRYHGGGYSGRGYSGHGSYGGQSSNRGSYGNGGNAGRSGGDVRGGSGGGSRGGSGHR